MDLVESSPRPEPVDDGDDDVAEDVADDVAEDVAEDVADVVADDGADDGRDPLRFSNWMKRSATGAVMTGIAFGLKEALQPKQEEVPFVIEARGEPDDPDKPIDLRFDPDSPADTVAIIRRPAAGQAPGAPAPPA